MPFKKIVSGIVLTAITIVSLTAWRACYESQGASKILLSDLTSKTKKPLSPPSLFQEDLSDGTTRDLRTSILHDMKLLTAVFAIGTYILVDRAPMRKLENAMRFKFSENDDFLSGINLRLITCTDGVIHIPYERDGRSYLVKVFCKEPSPSPYEKTLEELGPERFEVHIIEVPDIPKR